MARVIARPRARGSVRRSLWLPLDVTVATIGGGQAVLLASLNAAALAMRPFTIVRTHMALYLQSDQAAAVETQSVAFGCAVVSDQAVGVGITAVPTPFTDMDSSLFFAHQVCFADAGTLTDRTIGGSYFQVDSKAMRKVDNGSDLVITVETFNYGVSLSSAGRILIKTN